MNKKIKVLTVLSRGIKKFKNRAIKDNIIDDKFLEFNTIKDKIEQIYKKIKQII